MAHMSCLLKEVVLPSRRATISFLSDFLLGHSCERLHQTECLVHWQYGSQVDLSGSELHSSIPFVSKLLHGV